MQHTYVAYRLVKMVYFAQRCNRRLKKRTSCVRLHKHTA